MVITSKWINSIISPLINYYKHRDKKLTRLLEPNATCSRILTMEKAGGFVLFFSAPIHYVHMV